MSNALAITNARAALELTAKDLRALAVDVSRFSPQAALAIEQAGQHVTMAKSQLSVAAQLPVDRVVEHA